MTREELEHIIRASGDITDQYEFVTVGSQSILGAVPRPEDVFTVSMEADIYPLQAPELADRIDGAIGEGSQFHETYGYYAQGVGPETACLPAGWMQRVHRIQNRNTQDRIGYCLDVLDLFLAKVVAAREKDREPSSPRARDRQLDVLMYEFVPKTSYQSSSSRLTVTTYLPGFCFDRPKTAFTSHLSLLSKKMTSPP